MISWKKFVKAREKFRRAVKELELSLPGLKRLQQKLVDDRGGASYRIETPVVYNSALDDVTADDDIKLILVADNPGRREQAAENRRYLIGPSGKIAGKFFLNNPSLGVDFLKNVIILNKTPIHTPRTLELRKLCGLEKNQKIALALEESQSIMASLLLEFQQALCCPVWITGYSEMKKGGIFETYTKRLKELLEKKEKKSSVFLFRHFSMNQFTIDLKKKSQKTETVEESLARIGAFYRQRIIDGFKED